MIPKEHLKLALEPVRLLSVSYTHLDVYKRQAVKISRAEIPRAKYGPSVSPSGEYAAIKYKISDSEWDIVMYRLEGAQ